MERKRLAAGVGGAVALVALAAGGFVAGGTSISPLAETATTTVTTTPQQPSCGDFPQITDSGACFAAGAIRFVFFHNEQGAVQFCKWRAANPGEWSRIKGYASTGTAPTQIITWQGGALKNALEAYFATGAPKFDNPATSVQESIPPNTAPNACTSTLVAPPRVGVTPGQTDATVTITTTTTP